MAEQPPSTDQGNGNVPIRNESIGRSAAAVRIAAENLYLQDPDWVTFYREIMGLGGVIRRYFRSRELLAEFEKTVEYREIQQMLTHLRAKGPVETNPDDPTQIVTVRLPKSFRDALRLEALEHATSMNKLCISKLLQIIDEEMVPANTPLPPKGEPEAEFLG